MQDTTTTGSNTNGFYSGTTSIRWTVVQAAPPKPKPLPDVLVDRVWNAVALLELDLPTTPAAVKQARRRLARVHHPDVGGDLREMQAVNEAADFLLGSG